MKISLSLAYDLLSNSNAVSFEGETGSVVAFANLLGEKDKNFITIDWFEPGNKSFYGYEFPKALNQEVELIGSSMFLKDDDGDELQLTLLQIWQAEGEITNGNFPLHNQPE